MKKEKQRLEYTINRFDHYFDSVNNKSAVYIAINTFITGGAITFLTEFEGPASNHQLYLPIMGGILLFGIFSLILLALTSIPYFTKKSDSLYYFGAIRSKSLSEFTELSRDQKEKKNLKDLREQVHTLSLGLTQKFIKLKLVGVLLLIQFVLLLPITYLLIFKN